MLGGMFAGHDQSGGELIEKDDGKKVKLFYGMSSQTAMEKHAGGVAEYRWVTMFRIIQLFTFKPILLSQSYKES